jgi:DNA-binding beta-propeller fold protein YncE
MKMVGFFIASCLFLNLAAAAQSRDADASTSTTHVLYVETNNVRPGMNAVLAYTINPADGSLSLLGTYPTGGTGIENFDIRLGPDDHDKEIIFNQDKTVLFAVNAGSNTIAVFTVNADGSLVPIPGSPFASWGPNPTSMALVGDKLVVVNANSDDRPDTVPNNTPTNYTVFHVSGNGHLEHIPGSSIELAPDANPMMVAVSGDGKFVFGIDFFANPYPGDRIAPFLPTRGSFLETFTIQDDGTLQRSPGSPYVPAAGARVDPAIPQSGYLLGMAPHPTEPIVYVGEAFAQKLGVYTYDQNGALSPLVDLPTIGVAACWVALDPSAKHVYTSDAGTNSVGVFDISDPRNPVQIQELYLRLPAGPLPPAYMPALLPTVNFQLSVDPTGKFLYVTSHAASPGVDFTAGNEIHVMQIAADGTLIEPDFSPVQLPVDGVSHPTGNAIR